MFACVDCRSWHNSRLPSLVLRQSIVSAHANLAMLFAQARGRQALPTLPTRDGFALLRFLFALLSQGERTTGYARSARRLPEVHPMLYTVGWTLC